MESPGAVPGWGLVRGDVRRSIEDTHALHKHMASLASFRFRNSWGVARLRFLFWNEPGQKNFSPSQSPTAKLESRNADRIPFSAS